MTKNMKTGIRQTVTDLVCYGLILALSIYTKNWQAGCFTVAVYGFVQCCIGNIGHAKVMDQVDKVFDTWDKTLAKIDGGEQK